MCYATTAQPKIVTDKIIQRYTHSIWFFKLTENDFKGLHLRNLKSLRRYHGTLHLHNLTFTKLVQFAFRILHLHNLKSSPTIWFYTTLAQPDFHFIRTTWLRDSALAQPEIFIFMVKVKWYISRYTHTPCITFAKHDFSGFFILVVCVC